ncbi:MAG TPA: ROK family transcriptional regulator, partial [Propionibacteriaceae bacterium]|nr:ROK family transcriptional regulator [Propionibacteriaceae bacterium]
MKTASSTVLQEHEERVLAALRDHGARTRAELGRLVGLSRSSLSSVTASLIDRGAIVVYDREGSSRVGAGRPAERLALDPASGQFIGMDFQHAQVDLVVADAVRTVVASGQESYAQDSPWHHRLQTAFDLVDRVATAENLHFGALSWIYAGIPGPYVPPASRVTLPAFGEQSRVEGYGVREALSGRYGVPASVDNNTRLAALAEATAAGGIGDLIYVRLGQGVGGGVVVDGRLNQGAHHLSGELGHVSIAGADGPCRCGKRGCLETIASLPAVLQALEETGASPSDGSDPRVEALSGRIAEALGSVLRPVVMALDPEEIVLAGPVLDVLPELLELTRARVLDQRFLGIDPPVVRGPRVLKHEGALGALQAGFNAAASGTK